MSIIWDVPSPGRKRETSDMAIMQFIVSHPDPVITSTEVGDHFDMSQQGAYSRLQNLVEDDLLNKTKKGGTGVYWPTRSGHKFAWSGITDSGDDS